MKKILSAFMILAFLAGGTARAQYTAPSTGDSGSKSHSHKQRSKKPKTSKRKKAGKGKKGKKGKGSKAKGEVKMENGTVTKSDLEIDLKGQ